MAHCLRVLLTVAVVLSLTPVTDAFRKKTAKPKQETQVESPGSNVEVAETGTDTVAGESTQEAASNVEVVSNKSNASAFFCPSLCIPCAYGDRTLLLSRSKGTFKTVLDIGVGALALSGIGSLWGLIGGAAAYGAYAVGDHVYAQDIADECPDFQIRYIEDGNKEYQIDHKELNVMMKEKTSPMYLFKKDLGKLFKFEMKNSKEATDRSRRWHELPPSLQNILDQADFLCGRHGGSVKIRQQEEGYYSGFTSWATGGFDESCKKLHTEYHSTVEKLETMEKAEDEEEDVPELEVEPDNGGEEQTEVIEQKVGTGNLEPQEGPAPDLLVGDGEEELVSEEETIELHDPEPNTHEDDYKEPQKPKDSKPVEELVVAPDTPDDTGNDEEETFYLDNEDSKTIGLIKGITDNRNRLIKHDTASSGVCKLMKVGAWGCQLVETDGICQCRYLRPQKCDTWFKGKNTLRPLVTGKGLLLMAKSLCECYQTKDSFACSFGFLDKVPKIAKA